MSYNIYTSHLKILNDAYKNGLEDNPETIYSDIKLKVPLRRHQHAVINKMNSFEIELTQGKKINSSLLFSKYGILGDSVGVGKTLMVLGHITSNLANKNNYQFSEINTKSNSNCYSYETPEIRDLSNAGCLVIVPHTLFRQWADEIETKTNLKTFLLKTRRNVNDPQFLNKICSHDIILVSNTLFKEVYIRTIDSHIRWKRIYIDEADSIELVSYHIRDFPNYYTNFIWFITASFINILFPTNYSLFLSSLYVQRFFETNEIDSEFRELIEHNLQSHSQSLRLYLSNKSIRFLNNIVNADHPLRGNLVIRCKKPFINQSIELPQLFSRVIMCKPSASHRIIYDAIDANVRQYMNAGDTKSALEYLGVKTETNSSLIQIVTENKLKELQRLQQTYEFKQNLEYSSEQAKENSLKHLQEKIDSVKEQIEDLKKRVENYKEEICPICYDDFDDPIITNCCSRVFCGLCLLQSYSRNPSCPLCRASINIKNLKKISLNDDENIVVSNIEEDINAPKKKIDSFFEIIEQNPKAKFLVFSRYDNSFLDILDICVKKNLIAKELKGTKDSIAKLLDEFKKGNVNILLMNTLQMGAGLNITEASHVILLHAMNHEEEKQILGRAYRVGRKNELHFIKLLYPNET